MKFRFRFSVFIASLLIALFAIAGCTSKKEEGTSESTVPPAKTYYTAIYQQESGDAVTIETEVGQSPDSSAIPAIPEKTGYDGAWSVTDFSGAQANEVVTVFIIYTPKTYEVSYNANGGAEITAKTSVAYHKSYILETPVREGYTFVGWKDAEGVAVALSGDAWRIAADVTLTAEWTQNVPNKYSVVFMQEGKQSVVYYVEEGQSLADSLIPVIDGKTGYTSAWSVNGQPAVFSNITANVVATPKYTAKQYVISFDSNGGSSIAGTVTVTYGQTYNFTDKKPTKTGVTFVDGWYLGEVKVGLVGTWEIDCLATETLTAKYCAAVTFKQTGQEDVVKYYELGTSVAQSELPSPTPVEGYIVRWSVSDLEKLQNLSGDVVVNAVMQDASWSPNK